MDALQGTEGAEPAQRNSHRPASCSAEGAVFCADVQHLWLAPRGQRLAANRLDRQVRRWQRADADRRKRAGGDMGDLARDGRADRATAKLWAWLDQALDDEQRHK